MTTIDATDVYYDPYDVGINADPYPTYARLREEAPVYHNDRYDFWALSRHADFEQALLDWMPRSIPMTRIGRTDASSAMTSKPDEPTSGSRQRMQNSRTCASRAAIRRGVNTRDMRPRCMVWTGGSSKRITPEGRSTPALMMSRMSLRVLVKLCPERTQVAVRNKTDDTLRTVPGQPMAVREENVASGDLFVDYIEWRAKHPADDLMTQLLNAEFEDEHGETRKLTRQEVLTYTAVLAGAGNETTGRLVGWLVKVLAEHPDQRREVVEDRSLIPRVIDETLRFEPTGHAIARYVAQDVEYHGTTIPAGSAIMLLLAAANRDHRRYPDPDTYDIRREGIAHLTFGYGLHYCLGASLARLEGRVALDELLNRFPEWDVDYDGMRLAPTSTVRGWERLPVVLP